MIRIGLLSDTHGLLRPEALAFLRGASVIVHGGDVGGPEILTELEKLAPVTAVRGNNDAGSWADRWPTTRRLTVGRWELYVIHDRAELDIDPQTAGVQAVICGHSHRPTIARESGVLYINPGSAGPRRFSLPVTVAELILDGRDLRARIVELAVPPPLQRRAGKVK